jgi:hypothetical protein
LESYSDIDITYKFCKNCATMYEDLTFKVNQTETESCPLCDFYVTESERLTEGTNLVNLILQKSRNLSNRLSYPIEIPTVNEIISITHPESSNFRLFSNNELLEQFQKFYDLSYLKVDKLKYEHSIAEFIYLADQCYNSWDRLKLIDSSSKVKYSLFRYSSLNLPTSVIVDDVVNCYNISTSSSGQTRRQHIEVHLNIPEGQIERGKTSVKPHILSSDFGIALSELNLLLTSLINPEDVVVFRTLDQGYQIRIYYNLEPALVIVISDKQIGN